MIADPAREEILDIHYQELKKILEEGLAQAGSTSDLYTAKGFLIEVQRQFKGLALRREQREELYNRLQEAFAEINGRIESERSHFEEEARRNYALLYPGIKAAAETAGTATDTRAVWDRLLELQEQVKTLKLQREHRDELFPLIRAGFDTIRSRRDEEKRRFDQASDANYNRLRTLVNQGLKQAEESHEYKETREFLKKIQSEFKGVRLSSERREELYSRLQTAFDILARRVDDYFRNKKKNWMLKMEFNLSRFQAEIFELGKAIEKEESYLKELEDQYEIACDGGRENETLAGLRSRIESVRRDIREKKAEILRLESEKEQLAEKIKEPGSPEDPTENV